MTQCDENNKDKHLVYKLDFAFFYY